jgi:hypothetical protein
MENINSELIPKSWKEFYILLIDKRWESCDKFLEITSQYPFRDSLSLRVTDAGDYIRILFEEKMDEDEFQSPSDHLNDKLSLLRLFHSKTEKIIPLLNENDLREILIDLSLYCCNVAEISKIGKRNKDISDPPWLQVNQWSGVVELKQKFYKTADVPYLEKVGECLEILSQSISKSNQLAISITDARDHVHHYIDFEDEAAAMTEVGTLNRMVELRRENGKLARKNEALFQRVKRLERTKRRLIGLLAEEIGNEEDQIVDELIRKYNRQNSVSESKSKHIGQHIDLVDRTVKTSDRIVHIYDRQSKTFDSELNNVLSWEDDPND